MNARRVTPSRRFGSPLFGALLYTVLGFLAAQPLAAQRSSRPPPDSLRSIQSVIPLHGPPGTEVVIFTENLQLEAKIWIGIGRVGTGFEVIGDGTQGKWGAVDATVDIPEETPNDRPLVLIVLNAIFSPVALSEPFHVTDAEGRVIRTGFFVDEGTDCPAMRDRDGYLYTLSGEVGTVRTGDRVTVEGTYEPEGDCNGGNAIEVIRRIG